VACARLHCSGSSQRPLGSTWIARESRVWARLCPAIGLSGSKVMVRSVMSTLRPFSSVDALGGRACREIAGGQPAFQRHPVGLVADLRQARSGAAPAGHGASCVESPQVGAPSAWGGDAVVAQPQAAGI